MRNLATFLFRIILGLTLLISCQHGTQQSQLLFTEERDDWFSEGDSKWSFNEDVLRGEARGEGGFVMTSSRYSNFVLEFEFKPDSSVNSGVFVRCTEKELSASDCFEINIWDLHPNQEFRTGAIVTKSAPLAYVETIDRWNSYKIHCRGNKVEAWINKVKVAEHTEDYPLEGYIGLQAAGEGSVHFRNVSIKLLE